MVWGLEERDKGSIGVREFSASTPEGGGVWGGGKVICIRVH